MNKRPVFTLLVILIAALTAGTMLVVNAQSNSAPIGPNASVVVSAESFDGLSFYEVTETDQLLHHIPADEFAPGAEILDIAERELGEIWVAAGTAGLFRLPYNVEPSAENYAPVFVTGERLAKVTVSNSYDFVYTLGGGQVGITAANAPYTSTAVALPNPLDLEATGLGVVVASDELTMLDNDGNIIGYNANDPEVIQYLSVAREKFQGGEWLYVAENSTVYPYSRVCVYIYYLNGGPQMDMAQVQSVRPSNVAQQTLNQTESVNAGYFNRYVIWPDIGGRVTDILFWDERDVAIVAQPVEDQVSLYTWNGDPISTMSVNLADPEMVRTTLNTLNGITQTDIVVSNPDKMSLNGSRLTIPSADGIYVYDINDTANPVLLESPSTSRSWSAIEANPVREVFLPMVIGQ